MLLIDGRMRQARMQLDRKHVVHHSYCLVCCPCWPCAGACHPCIPAPHPARCTMYHWRICCLLRARPAICHAKREFKPDVADPPPGPLSDSTGWPLSTQLASLTPRLTQPLQQNHHHVGVQRADASRGITWRAVEVASVASLPMPVIACTALRIRGAAVAADKHRLPSCLQRSAQTALIVA